MKHSNEHGFISLDFIFGLVLVLGFCMVIFAMTFTLSAVEMTQYAAFATARSLYGAHASQEEQQNMAQKKSQQLLSTGAFKVLNGPLFSTTLLTSSTSTVSDGGQLEGIGDNFKPQSEGENDLFLGVIYDFGSKLLSFSIPMFGSTAEDPEREDNFTAFVNAFLGREPTQRECQGFSQSRYKQILELDTRFKQAPDDGYSNITDNGC